ncbi:hypothetical protein C3941_00165 [Kaistia algarum]|uniref:hypothetical protein n=1 Tax=Kaistia algarum TaxID=2083279 RepID=UPI000CE80EE5|nr:hypothetical protein [Kaistia algarum]MCX5513369.1 hypothetical protein [Kaistia algarum]PPE81182.1 hypothetical protein C3941_00165 [Kaistia algarum]
MISQPFLEILPPASRAKIARLDEDRRAAASLAFDAAENFRSAAHEYLRVDAAVRAKIAAAYPRELEATAGPAPAGTIGRQIDWRGYEQQLRKLPDAWNASPFTWRRSALPELARLQEAATRRAAELEGFAVLGAIESWLRRAANAGEGLKSAKPVAVPDGDKPGVVAACRRKLAELDAGWIVTEGAPLPVADMRAGLSAALDRIADRGEPVLDPRRRDDDVFGFTALFRQLYVSTGGGRTAAVGDGGVSTLVWLFRTEIEEKLVALLPRQDAPGALNENQREANLAEIAAARLECERIEEAAIVKAAAGGLVISRRRDADPRAILEVDA